VTKHHDATHEQWLQSLLTDEPSAEPPTVAACSVCRERLRELRGTAAALTAAASEQHAVMAIARGLRDAPGEDRLGPLLRRELRRRRVLRWWPLFAVAAALLVGVWLWQQQSPAPTQPPDRMLGTDDYRPTGRSVDDLLTRGFGWPREPGARFVLYLYDPANPLTPWAEIPCADNQWLPIPEFVQRMRSTRLDWLWSVDTVRLGEPGEPPAISRSDTFSFWLSP
jgi:hypothetical protein